MTGERNQGQDGRPQRGGPPRGGPPRGGPPERPDLDNTNSDRPQTPEQDLQPLEDARTHENLSVNQPAQEDPHVKEPAPERPDAETPAGEQPASGNHSASSAPNAAHMSISERLERNLITDVAGLTREEQDELLYWAKDIKKMKWKDIRSQFKFKLAEDTLRGRLRDYRTQMDQKQRPPRKAKFSERDIELLLEAIETLNGSHLDDVEKTKTRALWTRAKEYIEKHGGKTTAGPSTLKKKYKELTQEVPKIRKDLKTGKGKWNHDQYKAYQVAGQEEASFDDDAEEEDEPNTKSGTHDSGATNSVPNKYDWVHSEYDQYDVEWEDGADFGEGAVDQDDNDKEEEDEEDEDLEP